MQFSSCSPLSSPVSQSLLSFSFHPLSLLGLCSVVLCIFLFLTFPHKNPLLPRLGPSRRRNSGLGIRSFTNKNNLRPYFLPRVEAGFPSPLISFRHFPFFVAAVLLPLLIRFLLQFLVAFLSFFTSASPSARLFSVFSPLSVFLLMFLFYCIPSFLIIFFLSSVFHLQFSICSFTYNFVL